MLDKPGGHEEERIREESRFSFGPEVNPYITVKFLDKMHPSFCLALKSSQLILLHSGARTHYLHLFSPEVRIKHSSCAGYLA